MTSNKYAIMVGVLIAFTALIPVAGAFIGCAVGAFMILIESPTKALAFVVMFLILQQLENNLIYPRVVGGERLFAARLIFLRAAVFVLKNRVCEITECAAKIL